MHKIYIINLRFLPNGTNDSRIKLEKFIVGLNHFEFGSFNEFESLVNESLDELDHINITELYIEVNF